jgi:putative DNA primase/helicase
VIASPPTALAYAKAYAERGWPVFPVHEITPEGQCSCCQPTCSSPGKHPRTKTGLKEASTSLEQIEQWWARWPEANIGIATGEAAGIVVLDVDVDKSGERSLEELEAEHGELPTTTLAATGGGGLHYLFRHPGRPVRNSAGKLGEGLDVRGDGGYVVAPPSSHRSGRRYEWVFAPEQQEPAELPAWLLAFLRTREGRAGNAAGGQAIGDGIPAGKRNTRITSIAGTLRAQGMEERELRAALLEINRQRSRPPLPVAEVEAIAQSIAGYPPGRKRYKRSDYGNAERLVDRHGADIRYVPGIGWLVWDGTRWRRDDDGELLRRMKDTIRAAWTELVRIDDPHERSTVVRFLNRSESAHGLKAALELAQSEYPVVVSADELDADPWLLTVENGTLDLRSGQLRPPQRGDLMTRKAAARYEPDAQSDLWDGFLQTVTGGDRELQAFLQRAVGYSLTGHTSEEVLFFCHGPAASGKSTFLEAIKGVAADHALTTDFETLLKKPGGGGVRNDIARLAGARIVIGVEVDQGRTLAEGLIKQLTGGDRITARLLYREFFEFTPRFTLWLAANDRPLVPSTDTGIWRRILQLPFTNAIPEEDRDPILKQRLKDDPEVRSAILAWAVQGALDWQRHELGVPQSVRAYTEEYRTEVDPLTEFLEEHTILEAGHRVDRAKLLAAYRTWALRSGERALSATAFANALKQRGITDGGKSGNTRYWAGISLIEEPDQTDEPF